MTPPEDAYYVLDARGVRQPQDFSCVLIAIDAAKRLGHGARLFKVTPPKDTLLAKIGRSTAKEP